MALQQSGAPYICLYTSVFFENFMKPMLQYKKQLDGSILVIHPHGSSQSLQWHSADATGRAVAGNFEMLIINHRSNRYVNTKQDYVCEALCMSLHVQYYRIFKLHAQSTPRGSILAP